MAARAIWTLRSFGRRFTGSADARLADGIQITVAAAAADRAIGGRPAGRSR
ncbi:hypothetical protein I549_0038 [Mycobacterium avium subsp. avium 2285 (R)]|nr:hypothetical protein I549_0038 [Mycobacterium avium subsp. avium 2285 (R)]